EVLDEVCPRDVGVGELLAGSVLARNQPFFFEPYFQRFDFKASADQELLSIDHSSLHPGTRIFCFSGGPIRYERLKLRIDLVREHDIYVDILVAPASVWSHDAIALETKDAACVDAFRNPHTDRARCSVLARNQPFFFEPYFQRFDFKASADQELLSIDHSSLHPGTRIFCFFGGPIRYERLKLRIDLVREHDIYVDILVAPASVWSHDAIALETKDAACVDAFRNPHTDRARCSVLARNQPFFFEPYFQRFDFKASADQELLSIDHSSLHPGTRIFCFFGGPIRYERLKLRIDLVREHDIYVDILVAPASVWSHDAIALETKDAACVDAFRNPHTDRARCSVLARNQPFFFEPYFQRFDFKASADQELLSIDHSSLHPGTRIFCFSGGPIRYERLKLRIDLVREHDIYVDILVAPASVWSHDAIALETKDAACVDAFRNPHTDRARCSVLARNQPFFFEPYFQRFDFKASADQELLSIDHSSLHPGTRIFCFSGGPIRYERLKLRIDLVREHDIYVDILVAPASVWSHDAIALETKDAACVDAFRNPHTDRARCSVLARNQPFFFEPYFQRFDFKASADQELLSIDHSSLHPGTRIFCFSGGPIRYERLKLRIDLVREHDIYVDILVAPASVWSHDAIALETKDAACVDAFRNPHTDRARCSVLARNQPFFFEPYFQRFDFKASADQELLSIDHSSLHPGTRIFCFSGGPIRYERLKLRIDLVREHDIYVDILVAPASVWSHDALALETKDAACVDAFRNPHTDRARCSVLARNQPFFFDPYFQRFDFKASADQELLSIDHSSLHPGTRIFCFSGGPIRYERLKLRIDLVREHDIYVDILVAPASVWSHDALALETKDAAC